MKTFKEELTIEADNNLSNIDISEEIKIIKRRMKEYVDYRKYTINLIKNHGTMVIGGQTTNIKDIFIPKLISPLDYRQLFINELVKLGFAEEDMILSVNNYDNYDCYSIKVVW